MARNEDRIDGILDEIRAYWHANPDLRLGQVVINAATLVGYRNAPFYVEDDKLVEGLRLLYGYPESVAESLADTEESANSAE